MSCEILNDAAMQALGSYKAGACCFWDLGRAWVAMIVDGMLEPMELAHLAYKNGKLTKIISGCAARTIGKKKWRGHVAKIVKKLRAALERLRRPGRGKQQEIEEAA